MTLKKDIFLFCGLFSLVFGIFVSVSVPSLFHIIGGIPLILYSISSYKTQKMPKSSIALLLLLFWGYVSNIANYSDLNDVVRSFGKQKYIIFSLLSLLAFPAFFKSYMTQKRINFLIKTFFFTILSASIYSLIKIRLGFDLLNMEIYDGTNRSNGFTDIMRYGYGTGFVISILAGAILHKSSVVKFISFRWLLATFVFALIGMFESQCRGAILGSLCSIPFILYFRNKKLGISSFFLVAISVVSVVLLMVFGGNKSSRLFQKIASPSNLMRFSQYHAAAVASVENPILGVGVNQFSSECHEIKNRHGIFWPEYCAKGQLTCDDYSGYKAYCSHAHNIFLEASANTGLIGLIFFVLWLALWVREMFQRKDIWGYLIIPFIVNLVVAGQFEYVFDANNSFMIFLIYPLSFLKKEHLNFSLD